MWIGITIQQALSPAGLPRDGRASRKDGQTVFEIETYCALQHFILFPGRYRSPLRAAGTVGNICIHRLKKQAVFCGICF
jgi:hypothetical protein